MRLLIAISALVVPLAVPAQDAAPSFAKDVAPIFASNCVGCHASGVKMGALDLDTFEGLKTGGSHGSVITPGKSAESLIIQAVAGTRDDIARMPKKKDPLTVEQIGLLRAWIDQGADWPEAASAQIKDPKQHWAFRAPIRTPWPRPSQRHSNVSFRQSRDWIR